MIEEGKRIGVRWNKTRIQKIRELEWEELDESTALTRALKNAQKLDQLKNDYNLFLSGDLTLGELIRKLNQL